MTTDPEVKRLQAVYHDYHRQLRYQRKWSEANPGNQAIVRERNRLWQRLLSIKGFLPLAPLRILDVGCGSGKILATLQEWGARPANLYGIDLCPDSVAAAKGNCPETHFQLSNAAFLGFRDNSFDLVLLFTVFSSILDIGMVRNVAREVSRVLKPGGAIVWYDFIYNNPTNPHVRGLKRSSVRDLFPEFQLGLHKITLFPPLARRLGPLTSVLYPVLAAIPWLRTHYIGLLHKPMR